MNNHILLAEIINNLADNKPTRVGPYVLNGTTVTLTLGLVSNAKVATFDTPAEAVYYFLALCGINSITL